MLTYVDDAGRTVRIDMEPYAVLNQDLSKHFDSISNDSQSAYCILIVWKQSGTNVCGRYKNCRK